MKVENLKEMKDILNIKSEKRVSEKIVEYLKSIGAYVIRNANATKSGVPDLTVLYEGNFYGLELKKSRGGVVSEVQKNNFLQIEKNGGISFVANDLTVVIKNINKETLNYRRIFEDFIYTFKDEFEVFIMLKCEVEGGNYEDKMDCLNTNDYLEFMEFLKERVINDW